eukprot:m.25879 g.25879  ORF g.25879 m.25879 type:complete len:57 (+) comp28993_c1_seq1:3-173(+)
MDMDDIESKYPNSYLILQCCSVMCSQDIPQEIVQAAVFSEKKKDTLRCHLLSVFAI